MAGRVNTKFVFVLSSVLIFLVASILGAYFLFFRNSAEELANQGDLYMQEGQVYLAAENYGKAVQKDPNSTLYVEKYLNAITKYKVTDNLEANKFLGHEIMCKEQLAYDLQTNEECQIEYYETLINYGKELKRKFYYEKAVERANRHLQYYPNDAIAKKYRGIAKTLLLNRNQSDSDRKNTLADLLASEKLSPKDQETKYYLALYFLFEANRNELPGGDRSLVDGYREQAADYAEKIRQSLSGDYEELLRYINLVLHSGFTPSITAETTEAEKQAIKDAFMARIESISPALEQLESEMLSSSNYNKYSLIQIANLLARTDIKVIQTPEGKTTTNGIHRATKLLKHALKNKPNDISYTHELGHMYLLQRQKDAALPLYKKVINAQNANVPAEFIRCQLTQFTAAVKVSEILLDNVTAEKDEAKKNATFNDIQKSIDFINNIFPNTPQAEALKGKLLVAQNKLQEAQPIIEKAQKQFEQYGIMDPKLIQATAETRLKQGNWGAAIELYEQFMKVNPKNIGVQLRLAQLYAQHKQPEKSRVLINNLLKVAPDNETVKALHAAILVSENKIEDAITIYETLDLTRQPRFHQMLAILYSTQGKEDKAKNHAISFFEAKPEDIKALELVLSFAKDDAEKENLIKIAKDSGANPRALKLLTEKNAGKLQNLKR